MATYKVIQDIEAEDKFLGPLTLKQFIFAGIAAVSLYLSFVFVTRGAPFLVVPLLPVIFITGFLSFPWGRDQPTEVWLMGKLRFYFKPRKRIWDQSGIQELVTITAPKHDNIQYTNNLSQFEVKSRLRALADTIDSRGWAVKNVNVNLAPQNFNGVGDQFSDRLIDASALPQEVPSTEVYASDDIMDTQNNPLAQQLDMMISNSSQNHREAAIKHMDDVREGVDEVVVEPDTPLGAPAPNYWFINKPDPSQMPAGFVGTDPNGDAPTSGKEQLSPEEQALLDQIHKEQEKPETSITGHLKVIQPLSVQAKKAKAKKEKAKAAEKAKEALALAAKQASDKLAADSAKMPAAQSMTPPPDPAILELAVNNDRVVASLAREANIKLKRDQPDEIVVKLH